MGYSRWTNGSNPASMRGGRVWNNSAIYGIIGNNYLWGILVHHGIFFNNGIFSNITGYIGIFMLDLWDIYPVIYPKRNPNVGKYTSTLGHLGWIYHEKSGVL